MHAFKIKELSMYCQLIVLLMNVFNVLLHKFFRFDKAEFVVSSYNVLILLFDKQTECLVQKERVLIEVLRVVAYYTSVS